MSHDHKIENELQVKETDGDRAGEQSDGDRNPATEPTTAEDVKSSFDHAKQIIRDVTKDLPGTFGHHHS